MPTLHPSPHTAQLIEGIAQISLATVVTLVSVATAATLIYVWLFT